MARDWEETFRSWARPPSQTEDERCGNAESVIQNAIRGYAPFSTKNIRVFSQGSYRNGTNIKINSDVDVCVLCMDFCFSALEEGVTDADTKLVDASYTYQDFKDEVEKALRGYLGYAAVTRGNKAFDLHENSYRVDADVVPTFEHRHFYRRPSGEVTYISGAELHPDKGGRIINWPEQNYRNGTDKNQATGERFKKMVRILKRLREEMVDVGASEAEPIPSYLLECLVWNVPNNCFGNGRYTDDLRQALIHLYNETKIEVNCSKWCEINGIKYLFHPSQPWRRDEANAFIVAAWNYAGME